jgi:hypothetical protein
MVLPISQIEAFAIKPALVWIGGEPREPDARERYIRVGAFLSEK